MHSKYTQHRIFQRLRALVPQSLSSALFAALVPVVAILPPYHSANADTAILEEMIITARKRFETVQDVPVSVAAMGEIKLQEANIDNLEELSFYMPNVTISKAGSDDNVFIRGVGSGVNLGFERSVGTYLDGVYLGRGKQSRAAFLDLQRVEVLKGPQGILFGKNTIGGAINITTVEPTEELDGYIDSSYEPDGQEWDTRFVVSSALTDNLRGRVATRYREMDGYLENAISDIVEPNISEYALRLTLIWDMSVDLEIALRAEVGDTDIDGSNQQLYRVDPEFPRDAVGKEIGPLTTRFDDKSDFAFGSDGETLDGTEIESHTLALTVNYSFDDYSLTSITAISGYDAEISNDADNSPRDSIRQTTVEEFQQASQELRLLYQPEGDFEYLTGIYYEQTDLDVDDTFLLSVLVPVVDGGGSNAFAQDAESVALFGQLTWHISDVLRWSAGLRYGADEKDVTKVVVATGSIPSSFAAGYVNADERKNSEITWSTVLQYDLSDDQMIYASLSTGYKDGGFDQFYLGNFSADAPQLSSLEFDEEKVKSIEIGIKNTLLDGAMTLNAALFRSEFKDLQTSALVGVTFAVANAGKSVSQGLELDSRYALTEQITLGLAAAYLDAFYDEFDNAACTAEQIVAASGTCTQDLTDAPLQYSPQWSGNLNIEWRSMVSDSLSLMIQGDLNYSDSFFTAQDEDPFTEADAFSKLNMRIGVEHVEAGWEVALVGKNLTDEKTTTWINDVPVNVLAASSRASNSFFARTDRRRTIAVQGIYRF